MVTTQRGSSGATFIIGDWTVTKNGDGRVGAQGKWMEEHPVPSLPQVYSVSDNAYQMERLTQPPVHLMSTETTLEEIAVILQRDFWSQPAVVEFEYEAHTDRLAPLPITNLTMKKLLLLYHRIDWSSLTPGLTHGDPILDNLMLRYTGELVLADPIPATPALPDLISVDIGRLLQSAVGYERVRYGLPGPENAGLDRLSFTWTLTKNDMTAALYFAAIHCLRSMVYVDGPTAQAISTHCLGSILDEV